MKTAADGHSTKYAVTHKSRISIVVHGTATTYSLIQYIYILGTALYSSIAMHCIQWRVVQDECVVHTADTDKTRRCCLVRVGGVD